MDVTTAADEVEVISRAYARIHGLERTDDWILLKFQEEVGELTQAYLEMTGRSRTRGRDAAAAFRSEVADVFAQLLVLARRFDVDVAAELEAKWFAFRDVVTDADRAGLGPDRQDGADPVAGAESPVGADEPGYAENAPAADGTSPHVSATIAGARVDVQALAVMPMNFDQVHRFAEPGAPTLVPYELRAPVSAVVAACERDYAEYLTEVVERPRVAAGPGERWLRETGPVPLTELPARAPEAFLEFMDVEAYPLLLHWELWGVLHSGRAPLWSIACVDSCRLVGDELVVCGRCFAADEGGVAADEGERR